MKTYYELSDKTFVNPYHFVPLENECRREINYTEHRKQKDLKTGWIECELETLTPIFVPNTINDDFFKERQDDKNDKKITIKSYDFFSYQNNSGKVKPTNTAVIPGSSIRGVIRSAFETLTNSCMSTIDDKQVLYKRVTKAAKPGRLIKENGQWKIVECEKYMVKTENCKADPSPKKDISDYKDKQEVYIKPGKRYHGKHYMPKVAAGLNEIKTDACNIKGYLHKGEPFGKRKHHESVFVEKDESFRISEQDVENLLKNYRLYQDEAVNLHKKYEDHKGYESNIKNAKNINDIDVLNGALIYYAPHDDNRYYLSPAAIGREVFHTKLTELIQSYSPCHSHDKLCPACALFGFAGHKSKNNQDKTKNAIASRICFSAAKTENPSFLDPVILPELAGPKISSTELYLKKPDGKKVTMWNYDYAELEVKNYKPEIHGRKFYWHHENMKTFDEENKTRFNYKNNNKDAKIPYSNRLVKVRPVNQGVKFNFRIHFNQLTENELDKLLWALSMGNNNDLAHKIGMGKPVGLGSVRIKIDEVILRKLSVSKDSLSYATENYGIDFNDINLGCSPDTQKAFEKIADFKNKPKNIHYPYCIDEKGHVIPENYEWFVGNKQINGVGTSINHIISENLKPVNSDYTLRVIKKCTGNPPKTNSYTDKNSPPVNNQVNVGKSEVDKLIEKIETIKQKKVKKILSDLEKLSLSEDDIQKIKQKLKKRSDSDQRTNPMVQEYLKIFESMQSSN